MTVLGLWLKGMDAREFEGVMVVLLEILEND